MPALLKTVLDSSRSIAMQEKLGAAVSADCSKKMGQKVEVAQIPALT
jgi:hypothetical protein